MTGKVISKQFTTEAQRHREPFCRNGIFVRPVKKRRYMMKDLQKMGGIAALYAGAAYVVGMVGFLFVVNISDVVDPVQVVRRRISVMTIRLLSSIV
jgi:hypothetical protein